MANDLITVFGGSGFLGRLVVKRLGAAGYRVRVAVRRPNEAQDTKPMGHVGQITPVAANIRDEASVAAAIHDADAVINLAGILDETGKQKFDAVNDEGAGRIARLAQAAGAKRLIHVSALGADPESPSRYGQSKAGGEVAVRAEFPDAVILRPATIFGVGDSFTNKIATLARLTPVLPLIGWGKTRLQPVYGGDVADAVMAVLEGPESGGKMFELAGPEVLTLKDLIQRVLGHASRSRILAPMPFFVARMQAWFIQKLPWQLLTGWQVLTVDQVRMLEVDNVASGDLPGLDALGITATPMDVVLPGYMVRFRPQGQFTQVKKADTQN